MATGQQANEENDQSDRKLGYLSWADREELGKRVLVMRKTARIAGFAGFALLLSAAVPIAVRTSNERARATTRTVYVNLGGGVFAREVAPKRDYVLEMGIWVPRENVLWLKLLYVLLAPALCISAAGRYWARRMRRRY